MELATQAPHSSETRVGNNFEHESREGERKQRKDGLKPPGQAFTIKIYCQAEYSNHATQECPEQDPLPEDRFARHFRSVDAVMGRLVFVIGLVHGSASAEKEQGNRTENCHS